MKRVKNGSIDKRMGVGKGLKVRGSPPMRTMWQARYRSLLLRSPESRSVNMAKHWFIFSGSRGRQCWERAIIYRSLVGGGGREGGR